MIKIENASKVLSGKTVLDSIHMELKEGDCVLLRGHNGCGKTMLLRLLAGLIKPTQGNIVYENDYKFGVIIENPHFFLNETAFYNLKYLASINKQIDDGIIDSYLKSFNLFEFKNKRVSKFSLGMKQRLALCQAFMEDPDIILLDEPFNALDDINLAVVYEMLNGLKDKGKIIVIASHGESVKTDVFNKVIQMENGKICAS